MWFFIIFIAIQIMSVSLCALAIKKLYAYINQYRLSESVYTLLFRFIRLRYFVYLYAILVATAFALGVLIAFSSLFHPSL